MAGHKVCKWKLPKKVGWLSFVASAVFAVAACGSQTTQESVGSPEVKAGNHSGIQVVITDYMTDPSAAAATATSDGTVGKPPPPRRRDHDVSGANVTTKEADSTDIRADNYLLRRDQLGQ